MAAVVFDLDGTLFDHDGSAIRGVAGLVSHLGGQITPALAAAWFAAEERHVQSWVSGSCSWQDQRRRRVREFLPLIGVKVVPDDTELDRLFNVYLAGYERSWSAFGDAAPALRAVHAAGFGWRC